MRADVKEAFESGKKRQHHRFDVRLLVAAALIVAGTVMPARAQALDPVREWNAIAARMATTSTPALSPVQQSRAMAIVQVAVHDAVNGLTRSFATYRTHHHPSAKASVKAAAIAAAHAALLGLFHSQGQADDLAAKLAASLTLHHIKPSDRGLEYGAQVANDILDERMGDGSDVAQFEFNAPGAGQPGIWVRLGTPPAPALLPGWGKVTPFVLRSGSQFLPGPPPWLRGDRYAADLNEIKAVGAATGSTRTDEQTHIAFFWRASPVTIWTPVVDQMLAARHLDLSSEARTLALVYLAAADASIVVWEAKYIYNFWRPFPAIAGADTDGNPDTVADPSWRPLLPTPTHPEYPSAHTSNSRAIASILNRLFGRKPGVTFTVTLTDAPSGLTITRKWHTFDEAVDEVIDARVFSGIHFRHSDEVGSRLGRQTARFVYTHALRPCHGRAKHCGN
jgi:hypothetical protein